MIPFHEADTKETYFNYHLHNVIEAFKSVGATLTPDVVESTRAFSNRDYEQSKAIHEVLLDDPDIDMFKLLMIKHTPNLIEEYAKLIDRIILYKGVR